jgi:hypothetical protein
LISTFEKSTPCWALAAHPNSAVPANAAMMMYFITDLLPR